MPTVLPAGPGAGGLPRARGCARRLHQPQGAIARRAAARRDASAPPRCAGRRWSSALRPDLRGRAAARQCRDAAAQARRRRGRRDAARARRPEAARPGDSTRPRSCDVDEFLPAVGQGAIGIETRADDTRTRELLARDRSRRHRDRARRRARLPRRARRLLPHADRAAMPRCRGDALHFRGMIAEAGRQRSVRDRARAGDAQRCRATLGADAGRELKRTRRPGFLHGHLTMRLARHPPAGRQRTHRRRVARARARGAGRAAAADRAGGGRSCPAAGAASSSPAPMRRGAIAGNPACKTLFKLPLFAVGQRSADAARQAGFADVTSADGDVRDLVQLIAARHADASAPLLYLAGEDRAADLVAELAVHGIAAEMVVVYRAVTRAVSARTDRGAQGRSGRRGAAFFQAQRRELHRRRAGRWPACGQALAPRHVCLSAQIAEPLSRRRRQPHRRGKAAGRGGADRTSGAGPGLIGASAPFALFPAGGRADSPRKPMADKRTTPETPARSATGRSPWPAPQEAGGADHRSHRHRNAAIGI